MAAAGAIGEENAAFAVAGYILHGVSRACVCDVQVMGRDLREPLRQKGDQHQQSDQSDLSARVNNR